jgi:hypothetical protein
LKTIRQVKALCATGAAVIVALAAVSAGQAATRAAPVNTASPTVSGTTTVGQTLTASNGTWTNSPTSFEYQWLRCNATGASCVNAPNGTQKTYTLVGGDRGHTMRVKVTATNADGSASAQSDQTAVVAAAAPNAAPKNTVRPSISGDTTVGDELTADQGTWTGSPTSYSYQWERCDFDSATCTVVLGATGKTYGVRSADVGFRVRVNVTAKNAKGSANANSLPSDVVTPKAPPKNGRPTLSIVSVRFVGAQVYARFRICDDAPKNVSIIERDSRPGKASFTRRFSTLVAPDPCGVYTRHWLPAARFRGPGRFTVTLTARDKSGLSSVPVRRSFSRG